MPCSWNVENAWDVIWYLWLIVLNDLHVQINICYEIVIKIKRCVNHLWLHATPQSCLYCASFCSILSHGFCLISNQFHRKHCIVNDIESVILYDIIFACIESYQFIYNVSCWKVILTCILYNSISYIYIYTCLLENESGSKHVFKTPVRHLNSSSVFLTAPAPANELFCLWDENCLLRKIRN